MLLIDLSSPRKHILKAAQNIQFNLSLNEHITKKCGAAALGTLAAVCSFNNTAFAESLKTSIELIDNHLYPNLFALYEILKQTNYPQISLAVKQIENMH